MVSCFQYLGLICHRSGSSSLAQSFHSLLGALDTGVPGCSIVRKAACSRKLAPQGLLHRRPHRTSGSVDVLLKYKEIKISTGQKTACLRCPTTCRVHRVVAQRLARTPPSGDHYGGSAMSLYQSLHQSITDPVLEGNSPASKSYRRLARKKLLVPSWIEWVCCTTNVVVHCLVAAPSSPLYSYVITGKGGQDRHGLI